MRQPKQKTFAYLISTDKVDFETIVCSLQLRTICLTIGVDIFDKTKWM